MADRLVSTRMAADRLAISEPQVRKLLKKGALVPVRIGRALRFREGDLDALARDGFTMGPNPAGGRS